MIKIKIIKNMKKRMKILLSILVSICLFFNISFCYAAKSPASTNFGLNSVNGTATAPSPFVTADLPTVVGNAIKIFIGLSSTIMLIMVLWAGFEIMFAGGNADKRKKATSRIVWTSVGIIIIISAYALSQFIINQISFLSKA